MPERAVVARTVEAVGAYGVGAAIARAMAFGRVGHKGVGAVALGTGL